MNSSLRKTYVVYLPHAEVFAALFALEVLNQFEKIYPKILKLLTCGTFAFTPSRGAHKKYSSCHKFVYSILILLYIKNTLRFSSLKYLLNFFSDSRLIPMTKRCAKFEKVLNVHSLSTLCGPGQRWVRLTAVPGSAESHFPFKYRVFVILLFCIICSKHNF